MKRKTKNLGFFLAGVLCLSSCTMAPEYTRPEAPVPAAWPDGPAYEEESGIPSDKDMAPVSWQDFFVDEQLQKLIIMALDNSRDLRVAALNMERLQGLYRIQRAELFPLVDATAAASKQRLPESLSGTGEAETVEQYSIGVGVSSYEVDLFGRVQSLKDAALAQYLATEQARRAVQISLLAQVAESYLTLAADRERLQLAEETLTTQQAAHRLMQRRFDVGASSELDLRQAQTRVDAARVDIALYKTLVAQDMNALNLIIGSPVPTELLPEGFSQTSEAIQNIIPGLPSYVLLRRPDVMEAENLLKGFNANIGAARAAYFPRIALTGSVGVGSNELSDLFKSGSGAWIFAPKIVLPIFDAGNRSAKLKVAEVDRDIALARYEKTIQSAFREVADALARQGTIGDQVAAQQSLVDAAEASYRLSRARYEKGIDSYLNVLDSQRLLYGSRQDLIAARLSREINRVTLYKVLGGGGD